LVIQEWDKVSTDVVTIRDSSPVELEIPISRAEVAGV